MRMLVKRIICWVLDHPWADFGNARWCRRCGEEEVTDFRWEDGKLVQFHRKPRTT